MTWRPYAACSFIALLMISAGAYYDLPWVMWPAIGAFALSHSIHSWLSMRPRRRPD